MIAPSAFGALAPVDRSVFEVARRVDSSESHGITIDDHASTDFTYPKRTLNPESRCLSLLRSALFGPYLEQNALRRDYRCCHLFDPLA